MVGPDLQTGTRGGLFYERGGRKVYVKQPGSPKYEARRSYQPTTGWEEEFPRKGRERAYLWEQCDAKGKPCFLRPDAEFPGHSGFPICPACRDGKKCPCKPVCEGVISAYKRAQQWGYDDVAEKALKLEGTYGCGSKQRGGNLRGTYYKPTKYFQQAYCPTPPPCGGATPVEYEMRKQPGKRCCRHEGHARLGPRQQNLWVEFKKEHKGLPTAEVSRLWKEKKAFLGME
jgi:hypothetical protein